MILDLPPPQIWLPPKPAIVRANTLKEVPAIFGAGMMMASGKADPVVTYRGGASFESNASSYSTTVNIGTASADRLVVAVFHANHLGANYDAANVNAFFSGATGVQRIALTSASGLAAMMMIKGTVAAGTSGTVGFSRAGNMGYGILQVWTITGLDSHTPVSTAAYPGGTAQSLLTRAGGVAICGLQCQTTDPTASGVNQNKQRQVANGTGGGYAQNGFHLNPTVATTLSVGGGYGSVSASWY